MLERFTERARRAITLANQEAQRLKHDHLGTEHLLLGMVKEGTGMSAGVLHDLGVDLEALRREVERLGHGPNTANPPANPKQTARLHRVFDYANEESAALNHNYIGTEHLMLGLLREPESTAGKALKNLRLTTDRVRAAILGTASKNSDTHKQQLIDALTAAAGSDVTPETITKMADALVQAGWRPRL